MHDELTAQDIAMMQKELDHRKLELMPELIEEVKRTRAFGDLSENFEYKAAKQAQNRNRSRIRRRMTRTGTTMLRGIRSTKAPKRKKWTFCVSGFSIHISGIPASIRNFSPALQIHCCNHCRYIHK